MSKQHKSNRIWLQDFSVIPPNTVYALSREAILIIMYQTYAAPAAATTISILPSSLQLLSWDVCDWEFAVDTL
jgi:hypothetical protein